MFGKISLKKTIKNLSICIFLIAASLQADVIVFDLGGVVLGQSKLKTYWNIGLTNFFGIYNPFNVESSLMGFLNQLQERTSDDNEYLPLRYGKPLPQIMCDWLAGKLNYTEHIRTMIDEGLKIHSHLFTSDSHRKLIGACAHFMFNPVELAEVTYVLKDGLNLMKKCYKKRDLQGNRKHKVYILSNWDALSFSYLMKNASIKKMLKYCDGILLSGDAGYIKPQPQIFLHLFEKFNINPEKERVVFIDDQEENIKTAQNLGIEAILYENGHAAKKALKSLKLL